LIGPEALARAVIIYYLAVREERFYKIAVKFEGLDGKAVTGQVIVIVNCLETMNQICQWTTSNYK